MNTTTAPLTVTSMTYSERTGVPMWNTVFSDGTRGDYMATSAYTIKCLLEIPRYAPDTKAGIALRYAWGHMVK